MTKNKNSKKNNRFFIVQKQANIDSLFMQNNNSKKDAHYIYHFKFQFKNKVVKNHDLIDEFFASLDE